MSKQPMNANHIDNILGQSGASLNSHAVQSVRPRGWRLQTIAGGPALAAHRLLVFSFVLLLALPSETAAKKTAAASPALDAYPLTITLLTTTKTVDLKKPFSFLVIFYNRSEKSVIIGDLDAIGAELRRRLELRGPKGVVLRRLRFTKRGVPFQKQRPKLTLESKEVREIQLAISLTHAEHSDYRFLRSDRPDDEALEHGLLAVPSGTYQIRTRFQYSDAENSLQGPVDLVSNTITVQFVKVLPKSPPIFPK